MVLETLLLLVFLTSGLMWCISIGPQHSLKISVPLVSELDSVFAKDSLKSAIKSFSHPIILGMVGGSVEFHNPQHLTNITHKMRE